MLLSLCGMRFATGGAVVHLPHMTAAKETTLKEVSEMLAHVVTHMATKEDVAKLDTRIDDLRTEMIDQFEHADKQFEATHDRLRDMSAEITVIHRRVERLEEQGASNAGFAKEIDHLLMRVAEIERHLGIDKKIAV
jgi:septal ring factor EnvC (AmiA/AmiB activator)